VNGIGLGHPVIEGARSTTICHDVEDVSPFALGCSVERSLRSM
jgi:hypothetical protein